MNLNFLTEPVPHSEAVKLIADKPAVVKEVFDRLPDEMKSRAFTITGIEDHDVLQAVRDEIATIPAGADWEKVKKSVIAKISPWFTEEGAAARAETLMSHHAFAAYSSAQARIMDAMSDVFPFRQYLSTKDGKVRASHAALDGIILPANHVFWTYHTPPWEWNCRCQVVELTEEDRDEELANDAKRPPESRRVLQGSALKQLDQGSLNRGLSTNVDVRTPKERGGNYQWSARDTTLPYEEIKTRWDAQTAADFETWAGKQPVGLDNLLDVLQGRAVFRESRMPEASGGKAVFEKLAREAALGKSFSSGGPPGLVSRMAAADAEKVTAFEDRVRGARIEHGLAFDQQGNTLYQGEGEKDSVEVPERVNLKGMGFTHSHPDAGSFSAKDVHTLLQRKAAEVRAATFEGTYSIRRKSGVFLSDIEKRIREVMPDITASMRLIEKEADFDPNKADDLLWRVLAQEGLIDYDYIPMKAQTQQPIREALSARPPSEEKSMGPAVFTSYPSSAYRDWLDGKTEYPGMSDLLKTLSQLSIEEGEPQS